MAENSATVVVGANFIKMVKDKLKLNNLFPGCSRIEDFTKREYFDLVTSRAVANLSTILEYSVPFAKVGGYILSYKSKNADFDHTF